jgi:hypothetical protein
VILLFPFCKYEIEAKTDDLPGVTRLAVARTATQLIRISRPDVWHTAVIPSSQEMEVGGSCFKTTPQKLETLSENLTKAKRAEGVVPVVEDLPSKCEALGSNPRIAKKGGGRKK